MRCRVIHTSFAPTVFSADAAHALRLLTHPHRWQDGPSGSALERALASRLGVPHALVLDSCRNALRLALRLLGVGRGDEVILQAFTCVSVPGPVLWCGARPVYADIDPHTFALDPQDAERKITPRTRAIVVQHTFGLPADLDVLGRLARARGIPVIEDCAHALGATYHGKLVGTFGDAAIFSFGRDKVISSVFGGALVVNAPDAQDRLRELRQALAAPPRWWIARQLIHTTLAPAIRQSYYCGGRELLRVALLSRLLSKALTHQEKWGGEPPLKPSRLANALAARARHQLAQLDAFAAHRRMVAQRYAAALQGIPNLTLPAVPSDRSHTWLRYAVRVGNRDALHAAARRAGIVLRDAWYDMVVAPRGTSLRAVQYQAGSCPHAEAAAATVVNLPTSPTLTLADADRVVDVVRRVLVT